MIIEKNPNLKEVAERNIKISNHVRTNSYVPCCGHDFWDEAREAEFGDVLLCNMCHCYYAKIKNFPWVTIKKSWTTNEIISYGTNHLGDGCVYSNGSWLVHVTARVTD